MWEMVKENLATRVKRRCGEYTSVRMGLQYAPEILDYHLDELKAGIDEKDELIGDFMQMGGKVAVVCNGYQFYLTRKMFDCSGNMMRDPSGCIRVGGKAELKRKGQTIRIVTVKEIASPDSVTVETLDGDHAVLTVPYTELKAA